MMGGMTLDGLTAGSQAFRGPWHQTAVAKPVVKTSVEDRATSRLY